MSTILLAVEIAAVLLAAVFAVLWMKKPTGPYEPVTFIALLLGSTVVEIIRRYLPQQTTAGADTVEIAALTEQAAELLRRLQDGRDRLEPASSPSSQTPPQVEDRSAESQDPLTERIYSLVTIQSGLVERLRKLAQLRGITIDEANPLKTHSVSSPFDDAVMKILDFATDIGRKHPIDIQHSDWVDKMAAAVNGYLDHIIENTERGTRGK
jgi:ABC-type transporter Mla subunit MlaD